jgi:hypothetical protein
MCGAGCDLHEGRISWRRPDSDRVRHANKVPKAKLPPIIFAPTEKCLFFAQGARMKAANGNGREA